MDGHNLDQIGSREAGKVIGQAKDCEHILTTIDSNAGLESFTLNGEAKIVTAKVRVRSPGALQEVVLRLDDLDFSITGWDSTRIPNENKSIDIYAKRAVGKVVKDGPR